MTFASCPVSLYSLNKNKTHFMFHISLLWLLHPRQATVLHIAPWVSPPRAVPDMMNLPPVYNCPSCTASGDLEQHHNKLLNYLPSKSQSSKNNPSIHTSVGDTEWQLTPCHPTESCALSVSLSHSLPHLFPQPPLSISYWNQYDTWKVRVKKSGLPIPTAFVHVE